MRRDILSSVNAFVDLIIELMKRLNGLQIMLGIIVLISICVSAAFSTLTLHSYMSGTGDGRNVSWKDGYEAGTITFGAIACTAMVCVVWIELVRYKKL